MGLLFVFVLGVAVFWLLTALARVWHGRKRLAGSGGRISIADALTAARGRSIVVGENHSDREGLQYTLELLRQAHERGYRTLGVEICEESDGPYSGLLEELETLRRHGSLSLSESDVRSSLDGAPGQDKPRMNRYWQMQEALRLGWRVVPIDPHHWNWQQEDAFGYLHSREPSMADAIRRRGPMIAVCGYGHLGGLHDLLGDDAVLVLASRACASDVPAESFWAERFRFATTVPRLTS
jgi:hypothetical protein